jgi:hypothetical protein
MTFDEWFISHANESYGLYSSAEAAWDAATEQAETQLAEEHEAHCEAMNRAFADFEKLQRQLTEDRAKWFYRGISGFQEAVEVEREACAKVCEETEFTLEPESFESRVRNQCAKAIRARAIQWDEDRIDRIGQNGNDGLAYQEK